MTGWKPIDTQKVIDASRKQNESTTSAGVGGFAVPLGAEPMRPPLIKKPKKKRKR